VCILYTLRIDEKLEMSKCEVQLLQCAEQWSPELDVIPSKLDNLMSSSITSGNILAIMVLLYICIIVWDIILLFPLHDDVPLCVFVFV
jgi:hypothetical protein